MLVFYNLGVNTYNLLVKIVSPFNAKAKLWVRGRKNIWSKLEPLQHINDPIAWFHVSSLGEFEQGRPVIEAFRQRYPHYKILLTFFSPSGYEIRKNYDGADYVFYLPQESKKNARKFITLTKPKIAFFVKYDFWYHYLNELYQQKIPTYIFSAIFRPNQLFFKRYGAWYRQMLRFFTKIYVQNQASKDLLANFGITHVEVGGDTRFDRVFALATNAKPNDLIAQFAEGHQVIVAGSTWEKDEELIASYVNKYPQYKWIIAPHEIHKTHIASIEELFNSKALKFSTANTQNISQPQVLIIDSIGLLSTLYRYGCAAYIGGGFGKGIHNTLEAATYGLPVVFGPNYQRFNEACDLLKQESAFTISNFNQFEEAFNTLLQNTPFRVKSGQLAADYVNKMRGGTQMLMSQISLT